MTGSLNLYVSNIDQLLGSLKDKAEVMFSPQDTQRLKLTAAGTWFSKLQCHCRRPRQLSLGVRSQLGNSCK